MSRFWPAREPSQEAYERLRSAALTDTGVLDRDGARFERRGLTALIMDPAEPVFVARLVASARPPWSPYADPRLSTLADAYQLLIARDPDATVLEVAE